MRAIHDAPSLRRRTDPPDDAPRPETAILTIVAMAVIAFPRLAIALVTGTVLVGGVVGVAIQGSRSSRLRESHRSAAALNRIAQGLTALADRVVN